MLYVLRLRTRLSKLLSAMVRTAPLVCRTPTYGHAGRAFVYVRARLSVCSGAESGARAGATPMCSKLKLSGAPSGFSDIDSVLFRDLYSSELMRYRMDGLRFNHD